MKKFELIVTVDGATTPDGKDRTLVIVGEPFVDPGLQPEFEMKPGSYVAVAFSCYKIDEERSTKDKTSFIDHTWRPSTGDMIIRPRKDSYKTKVTWKRIA